MSIDNNSARTLSGISAGNGGNISIPSTPDAIRIAGQSGPKGYLVGVDITSGNVDWVQAGTPFIPNDSILGVDLNSNIGFSTTASETGGIISITNPAGTGTLSADRVVATDFTLQNNFTANQGIFKDKVIMDTTGLGTGNTRKLDLVASNGDIIQYETFTPANEYASIKSGVGAFRSITTSGNISSSGGNITTQNGNITAVGSLGATQNVVANVGMTTGTLDATGTSTLKDTTTTSLLYTSSLIGRRTLLAGGNVDMFSVVMDDDGSVLTLKDGDDNSTIILDSDTGDSTLANLTTTSINCNGNIDCQGNLVVELLSTLKGNTEIQGNLSVLGNLTYGGDLNFNDLIFDGFFSQRLDGNDANSELVSSVITNSDANNFGGSVFKLKKKAPPQQLNAILESITFDSRVGSIDCSSITTTDLTATNFTFDNNLLVQTLTADDINVVNKNGNNATTIALSGETGALTLSGSSGKLTSVEVETSGEATINGDLNANADLIVNQDITARNITCNQGAPNGVVNCRRLVADEFEFDNNLITRELQSDRITLVDKDNNDTITIVLDGGVNPQLPDVPAGSMAITGEFSSVRQSTANRPTPNFMGGLQVGQAGNQHTNLKITGTLITEQDRAIINAGMTFTGSDSVIMSGPLLNSYSAGYNTFRKLKITSDQGEIKFDNASGKLEGYTNANKTPCFNLDLTDNSNLFREDQIARYTYARMWDTPSGIEVSWLLKGGHSTFQNMLGYNVAGGRRTQMDFTFQAGPHAGASNTSEIELTFHGRFLVGGFYICLRKINNDGSVGDIIQSTSRILAFNPLEEKQHSFVFHARGLEPNVDIKVAPFIYPTETSATTTCAIFDNGPSSGFVIGPPRQNATGPWSIKARSLSALPTGHFSSLITPL